MKLLICGDREWTDRDLIAGYLLDIKADHPDVVICHGAARGADRMAGEEATKLGIPVTEFPADWERLGKAAGPIRNREMLRVFAPTRVAAFHDNIGASRGTADMLRIAQAAGLEVDLTHHGCTL